MNKGDKRLLAASLPSKILFPYVSVYHIYFSMMQLSLDYHTRGGLMKIRMLRARWRYHETFPKITTHTELHSNSTLCVYIQLGHQPLSSKQDNEARVDCISFMKFSVPTTDCALFL